jgi:predicted short-subunit dehydrogenase-like oxidoreductase (DUF2520 family)
MPSILRYAARVKPTASRPTGRRKPRVAIVGAGSLASFLAPVLHDAGYRITEIVARTQTRSRAARHLAGKVNARAVVAGVPLRADLLWFAVPDREIRSAALEAAATIANIKFAFHSSGALTSRELDTLRRAGVAVASVHPLMTFVPRARPSLAGVPFALEGDKGAVSLARRIVQDLNAESFPIPARRKPAYHAWATMTSPLLVAYLVTLEEAAQHAGLTREAARRLSRPIVQQTFVNYARLGPAHSFSGPFIRGDASIISSHLSFLKRNRRAREVYAALGRMAVDRLPTKNRQVLARLLAK